MFNKIDKSEYFWKIDARSNLNCGMSVSTSLQHSAMYYTLKRNLVFKWSKLIEEERAVKWQEACDAR